MTDTEQLVHAYVAALRDGTAAQRFLEFFTPDATWTLMGDLPVSRTWTGYDGIFGGFVAELVGRFDTTQPITQELRGVLADGERAVAEWTTRATTKAGAPYVNDVVVVLRFDDGRIAEAREYFDTDLARRLLWDAETVNR